MQPSLLVCVKYCCDI